MEQPPCSRRNADFEGEHPLKPWPSEAADRPRYQAMPPRSYPLKPWPQEAQRRGWCPLSAPQSRLHLGTGAHAQHGLRPRLIGSTGDQLQPSPDADRTRIAKTETIPLGAKPTADAPPFVLTPHPSKRFQLRRPSESEGGVCCKPELGSTPLVPVPVTMKTLFGSRRSKGRPAVWAGWPWIARVTFSGVDCPNFANRAGAPVHALSSCARVC